MTRIHRTIVPALVALALTFGATTAQAQGKSKAAKGGDKAHAAGTHAADAHAEHGKSDAPGQKRIPPGQAKKVSTDDAIVASREVLTNNGYRVVRVETVGTSRVIWYRRGNMGKGKGQGPLMKMVVRPSNNIVVIQSTSDNPLAEKVRRVLGI